MLAAILSKISKLITDYTTTRAGYLDKLNITGNVADGNVYTSTRATKLDNLDGIVSSRAPASTAVSTADYTSSRATKLDNLDVVLSTRANDKGQKIMSATLNTSSIAYVTLLNVSGVGHLIALSWTNTVGLSTRNDRVRITVDGEPAQVIVSGKDYAFYTTYAPYSSSTILPSGIMPFNTRFKSSILIEVGNESTADSIKYNAIYSLDI